MPTEELIGLKIRELRQKRGMSQEQLANAISISKSSISEWESCKRVPRMPTLRKIAKALGVDVWEIIGFNEVPLDDLHEEPTAADVDEDDLWTLREEMRRDPNRRALMQLARNGTAQDVRQAMALIDAPRATNSDFYDGDDPA